MAFKTEYVVRLKPSIRLSIRPTSGKSKRFVFVESGILHGLWNKEFNSRNQEFRFTIESRIQIPLTSKAKSSTWNLESLLGIRNLRLSWIITLHGTKLFSFLFRLTSFLCFSIDV